MQVYNDLFSIKKDRNTVLTIGTFDGIHLGHQKIIERVKKKAIEYGARNFLITFDPHPKKVVSKSGDVHILSTLKEKEIILGELGIENLLIINFTKEFSQQSAEVFFYNYIIKGVGLRKIIIGYDHHFGKGRGGSIETLVNMGKNNDFSVEEIDAIKISGYTVSSSGIRKALNQGDIRHANFLLGRYYSFSGIVVHGDKRGRTLGFPTANIELDDKDKILPANSIYVVEFYVRGNKHFGLLSVGRRPTFYDEGKIVPEVYIYNFDQDIYDEYVTVNVIERLRGEEKFFSVKDLVVQMNKDRAAGLKILSKLVS